MDLPSALDYPDYYQYIKHPISLNHIKSKLDSPRDPYLSLDKLLSNLKLVFKNAKKYNLEYSVIYKDAQALLVCHSLHLLTSCTKKKKPFQC
jgi:hypothetical protein